MKRNLLISFAVLMAFWGCQKEQDGTRETGSPLLFAPQVGLSESKAAATDQPDASSTLIAPGKVIGVFGTLTRTGEEDTEILEKQAVQCGEDLNWTYSPLRYWRNVGIYDFAAVYPYTADTQTGSDGKRLLIWHNSTSKTDLMIAHARRDAALKDHTPVGLQFRHACSAVRFLFKKGSTDYAYHLQSFVLQNLRIVGVLDTSGEDLTVDSWHTTGQAPAGSAFSWSASSAADRKEIPLEYDDYTGAEWYYMIPQSMVPGVGYEHPAVSFSVIFNNEPTPVTTTLELPDSYVEGGQSVEARWEPGKVYNYYINLQPSRVAITVRVTEWDQQELVVDDITFD